jgi:hypothetical protein
MESSKYRELIMKNVTLSQLVRAHQPSRFLCPVQSWGQLLCFSLTLAIGLAVIAVVLKLLDPSAPLAFILVPAIIGGSASMFAVLPARFDIVTRFHARHLLRTLDEAIVGLGYAQAESITENMRYHARHPRWLRWKENEIAVTVREHAIEISGPIFALRELQKKLAA